MSLATKYRPKTFDDVCEQDSVKVILKQQLESGEIQHAYLYVGSAGCGKTTCARIFSNEANKGRGNPIEIDAASNNSVDDVRNIIQQAKVKSMDSDYRIFILDECHMLSNSAWNAMLKLLEEPPKTAVFIMCTTNPEKIPKTIMSRVQRFDFKRISQQGIVNRLREVLCREFDTNPEFQKDFECNDRDALPYLARISEGGMRDALTLLEKCLAYSKKLTVENIVKALGTVDYDVFFGLSDAILNKQADDLIKTVENVYADGKDLKQFIKDYMGFLLDINKYDITHSFDYMQLPNTYADKLSSYAQEWFDCCRKLLPIVVGLNAKIKWDTQPKVAIEAELLEVTLC